MVKYIAPIDSHVHLRWTEYADWQDYPFLKWAFEDAQAVRLAGIVEIGNTLPPFNAETVKRRKAMVERYSQEVSHSMSPVITCDLNQTVQILKAIEEGHDGLRSDKMFCMHSTGDCGILDPRIRRMSWFIKAAMSYRGVSRGHFQDPSLFDKTKPFDYRNPVSHSWNQTKEAEIKCIEDNVRDACDAGFRGVFESLHTSTPEAIDFLNKERKKVNYRIVIEVTPAHMFLNTKDYEINGNGAKMNPALRESRDQEAVLERVTKGEVDIIGTDHAGHPGPLKQSPNPPSGMPGINIYPWMIAKLKSLGVSNNTIRRLTFDNPNELFFDNSLRSRVVETEYDPSRWDKYGYNPFSRVDGTAKAA